MIKIVKGGIIGSRKIDNNTFSNALIPLYIIEMMRGNLLVKSCHIVELHL
jgi:hypothetical protein